MKIEVAAAAVEARNPSAANSGRRCEGGMIPFTSVKAERTAAAAVAPVVVTATARPSTLGSTAAGTTAVTTTAMAAMTADTTRPPSRKGASVPSV